VLAQARHAINKHNKISKGPLPLHRTKARKLKKKKIEMARLTKESGTLNDHHQQELYVSCIINRN
jgi:hypothetical protein